MNKTIKDIIDNNEWRASDFLRSSAVQRFFKSGIITDGGSTLQNEINAENTPPIIHAGLSTYDFQEVNTSDLLNTRAVPLKPKFEVVMVKSYDKTIFGEAQELEAQLMRITEPSTTEPSTTEIKELVLEYVGRYWANTWNKQMSAILSGLTKIDKITVGDGTQTFSKKLVYSARLKKGDEGFNNSLSRMVMSSNTLDALLNLPDASPTQPNPIMETRVGSELESSFTFNNAVPIVVDDVMPNGIVSLVYKGAFAFAFNQKNTGATVLEYTKQRLWDGFGFTEIWSSRMVYALHPMGFEFKGEHRTDYTSGEGLTLDELKHGNLYELAGSVNKLADSVKNSPILNIKVAI